MKMCTKDDQCYCREKQGIEDDWCIEMTLIKPDGDTRKIVYVRSLDCLEEADMEFEECCCVLHNHFRERDRE